MTNAQLTEKRTAEQAAAEAMGMLREWKPLHDEFDATCERADLTIAERVERKNKLSDEMGTLMEDACEIARIWVFDDEVTYQTLSGLAIDEFDGLMGVLASYTE